MTPLEKIKALDDAVSHGDIEVSDREAVVVQLMDEFLALWGASWRAVDDQDCPAYLAEALWALEAKAEEVLK